MGDAIRSEFPVLKERGITYLDSAATTLKPNFVIERIAQYYRSENGSPHRGAHKLSVLSTELYHQSKQIVKNFLNADSNYEVVYTKNTTEALNLIAISFNEVAIKEGDSVVIAITAHHSNILPWQRLCQQRGAELVYLYVDQKGNIPQEELKKIDSRCKLVSVPMVANGLGVIHDIATIYKSAKAVSAITVLDGAQAVGHLPVDLKALDWDFFAFSGHKLYAPQGIGVLLGKKEHLENLHPFMLGGDMIEYVQEQSASYAPVPQKFESGTQNVAGAVGLAAAIQWLNKIGYDQVIAHNEKITALLYKMLKNRSDIIVYGPEDDKKRGSLVSFNVKNVHPHDVASIVDMDGVAIRAGHHCCQPLMNYLDTAATCRASIAIYNTEQDIVNLESALNRVGEVFKNYAK